MTAAATESAPPTLCTYRFVVLTLVATFGFCNIAIFYGFSSYLERLGVPEGWRGWLLAAEPLAAWCLRPWLSVFVTPRNALRLTGISLLGMGLALCGYQFAHGIGALLAVRLFHGLCFVCLVSAVTVLLVQNIPRQLAGRGFGLFSLASLVPYAIMPPLVEWLLPQLGREDRVYALCSLLVLPGLALLAPLGWSRRGQAMTPEPLNSGRPSWAEVRQTLAQRPVRRLLLANLCLFLSTTLVFFYIKPFALAQGLADPGLFFTVSTGASIVIRVLAGPYYDRLPREALLLAALAALAVCLFGFAGATGSGQLLGLAAAYGLSLGVAMPLLNAVMFGHSSPAMRGTTLNLMLFMMDTAYVVGPVAGGAILASGVGYASLFMLCCVMALAAGWCVWPLVGDGWQQWRHPQKAQG
ncbi:MFS transporter [Megalodesulfovibrio gigas]|uniref:Putative arabinose efflux permease family protein n=1 Tax=Megalodesulfovibrio gigas (strain ATCC 19364 / DSM 1382 / NCIMB 9332 / VKM B-1759) TaxID=1121448 RepID=T2GE76_MEGG1|nr:MFS transporter [Megalodesulfovibrio gigas]AGW14207.1 putative arabinose efflux permease family protein [Megalodesulfovibrio gigas DSM 1382 = ATCC 19364]